MGILFEKGQLFRWIGKMFKLFVLCLAVATAMAEPSVHFKDDFSDSDWESRWTQSNSKTDYGKWKLSAGRYYADAEKDQGLQTSQDAKFYAISSSFDEFSNTNKALTVVADTSNFSHPP